MREVSASAGGSSVTPQCWRHGAGWVPVGFVIVAGMAHFQSSVWTMSFVPRNCDHSDEESLSCNKTSSFFVKRHISIAVSVIAALVSLSVDLHAWNMDRHSGQARNCHKTTCEIIIVCNSVTCVKSGLVRERSAHASVHHSGAWATSGGTAKLRTVVHLTEST